MANTKTQIQTVMGYKIAPPRLTKWAGIRLTQYIIGPFLGALLFLDILLYFAFKYGFDMCYGVMCFIE